MYNVNELRKKRKKRKLYRRIKIIITMFVLVIISSILISNYLNKEVATNKSIKSIEEIVDSGKKRLY